MKKAESQDNKQGEIFCHIFLQIFPDLNFDADTKNFTSN